MALCDLPIPSPPIDVAISKKSNKVAILTTKSVDIVNWNLESRKTAQAAKLAERFIKFVDGTLNKRLVAFTSDDQVAVISDENDGSCTLNLYPYLNEGLGEDVISVPGVLNFPTAISDGLLFLQTRAGKVLEVVSDGSTHSTKEVSSLPAPCPIVEVIQFGDRTLACGLTDNGRLYANNQLIASNCSSFQLTESYFIFTTTQHFLKFVHIGTDIYGEMSSSLRSLQILTFY